MLITTLVVSFLGCCRLEVRCRQAGVVSGLQVIARILQLTKSIYNALTYINLHFTVMKLIRASVETQIVTLMQAVFHLLSHFLRYFIVSLFTAFSSSLFLLFFIYFLLYLLHFFFILFPYLYFLFHLSLFVSFTYSFLPSYFQASFHTFSFVSCLPCSLFHDFNVR